MATDPQVPPPPTSDADVDRIQALLDQLPAALAPLDVSALDGWLCAVLLQPDPIAPEHWLPPIVDADDRPLPAALDLRELRALLQRRHAELRWAIERRQWFDPWIFELEPPGEAADSARPWVAGFALALERFGALLAQAGPAAYAPLALLYQYLPREDVELEDALRDAIDALAPPEDMCEAAEDLVQGVLQLADVVRPAAPLPPAGQHPRTRRPPSTSGRKPVPRRR